MASIVKLKKMEITKAIITDLEGIVQIASEIFPQAFQEDGYFSIERCREMFARALEDHNEAVYVAKDNSEILGFTYYINKPPTNGTVILEMMGVRKDYQKRGIGTRLLKESDAKLVQELKQKGIDIATIHLTTSEDNPVAQKLYLHSGYQEIARITGFVGTGNVELFMLKKVSEIPYREGLWNKG